MIWSTSMFVERRREERYSIQTTLYAYIHHPQSKIVRVMDLSISGFSFMASSVTGTTNTSSQITFLTENGFKLKNVPYTIVENLIIPTDTPHSLLIMQKFCAKFDDLVPEQIEQIISFVNFFKGYSKREKKI